MNDLITLDSNVFRNQRFIDWLMSPEAVHGRHVLPIIVYVEVLVWYEMRGLTREDLEADLQKMKTEIVELTPAYVDQLMENIRSNPGFLFRHHARDFLIGTVVREKNSMLITNNKSHFAWMADGTVKSPEEYLTQCLSL
jgi:predicted nucleic acid-binding protein